jgi:hypothetical protein
VQSASLVHPYEQKHPGKPPGLPELHAPFGIIVQSLSWLHWFITPVVPTHAAGRGSRLGHFTTARRCTWPDAHVSNPVSTPATTMGVAPGHPCWVAPALPDAPALAPAEPP